MDIYITTCLHCEEATWWNKEEFQGTARVNQAFCSVECCDQSIFRAPESPEEESPEEESLEEESPEEESPEDCRIR